MSNRTRIKVKHSDVGIEVLVLINHPMESGLRRDPASGESVPAHFVRSLAVSLDGELCAEAALGPAIAANPLIGFRLEDTRPGDVVRVQWTDNRGVQGGGEAVV